MKLYTAEAEVRANFSEKALEWYDHSDMIVQKNNLGLYFYRFGKEPVVGPFTLQEINDLCEHFQWVMDDEDIDWPEPDDEGYIPFNPESFFIDDDLANDIDRRTSNEG